ncbi:hypothetical protein [Niveibacterium sp.]|uniref:hypothetical protein n=1 Tax=Niveibacterium sp. TaxID=2017444 RepID=UPI0035B27062
MAAELALASLGAQTGPRLALHSQPATVARSDASRNPTYALATAALRAPEPDASVLLGVSEGDRKASTIARCRLLVARIQAAGRNPAGALEHLDTSTPDSALLHPSYEHHTRAAQPMVLTLGPVESAEQRSGGGASARSADGEDCLSGERSPARVPQPPDFASGVGKSGTQCLTANAGSPFLGYFFWRSKRSNTPAGGGTPADERLQTNNANRKQQARNRTPSVGLRKTQPNLLPRVRLHGAFANSRRLTP